MDGDHDMDGPAATPGQEAQYCRRLSVSESRQQVFVDYDGFYHAIMRGDVETVTAMLDAGADVHHEKDDGVTPLLVAIDTLHVDMVQLLLERGADVDSPVVGLPPLFHAVTTCHHAPRLLQLLLDYGADVEATAGPTSMTALHHAAVHGEMHAADFLMGKEVDIHQTCAPGKTAFVLAAEKGQTTVAKLLLAKGADLHARSDNGGTALMWAAHCGHADTVEYLLEQGMGLEDRDEDGLTALSVASRAGHEEVVTLLIEKGADVNARSSQPGKATPAMWAAISGHAEVLQTLIDYGADLSLASDDGLTIIEATLRRGHANAAKMLFETIGGPDYPSDSVALQIATATCLAESRPLMNSISLLFPQMRGNGPSTWKWAWIQWVLDQGGELVRPRATLNLLHFALLEEEVDMVIELLALGVDPNTTVFDGDMPLHAAVGRHNQQLVELFVDHGADPARPSRHPERLLLTPLHYAVIRLDGDVQKDETIVDILLATGQCRLTKGEDVDSTVFAYVLRRFGCWKQDAAERLAFRMLDSIPDVNGDRSDDGCTLMHAAVVHGKTELVDVLRQKGADANPRDKYGRTPFLVACQTNPELLEILLTRGADAFAVDDDGQCALHIAAAHGQVDALRYLLDGDSAINGTLDLEATDNQGHTPLLTALLSDYEEAAVFLLEQGASPHHRTPATQQTALHYACLHSKHSVVDRILASPTTKTLLNAPDANGSTPLALACTAPPPTSIPQLLSSGADANLRNPLTGTTPLHTALLAAPARTSPALLLLHHAATDPSARDTRLRTPLHLAALAANLPAARVLLARRACPNAVDDAGRTPLARCPCPEVAEALVAHGADVNRVERNGRTPAMHAVCRGWADTLAVLVRCGADLDARVDAEGVSVRERLARMADVDGRWEWFWKRERGED